MKRLLYLSTIALTFGLSLFFFSAQVYAGDYEDYVEKWLKKQREQNEKYMDELEADGNLTQEAIDSISKGTSKRKPNHKSSASKNGNSGSTSNSSSNYPGSGKGWVYSVDELHVIGLPEGKNGYTKPGWYGDID